MWFQASRRQRKGYNWPDKHHSGSVETKSVVSSVTAAASLFERGATIVAGYVYRWRSQHNYQKSFYYMDFQYLISDTYPPASPYHKRGLAAAVQLSTIQDYKRHCGSVETTNVKSSVTAAASPFERGATTVAGYVSRWRSQHKYQKSFYYMDFLYLFYDTYPPASPYPSLKVTHGKSPTASVIVFKSDILWSRL